MLEVRPTQTGFAVVRTTVMFFFGGAEHVTVLSEHATEAEARAALAALQPLRAGEAVVVTATPPAEYTGVVPTYTGTLVCTTIDASGRKGVVINVESVNGDDRAFIGHELAFGADDFSWERARELTTEELESGLRS